MRYHVMTHIPGGLRSAMDHTWRFEKRHGLHKLYIWSQQLGDDRENLWEDRKELC